MKVVEIKNRYAVADEKGFFGNIFAVVNDYTMLDSNLKFLQQVKIMVGKLGSITTVEEIDAENSHYKLMFSTSVSVKEVKEKISEVYTNYLKSDKDLTYPFDEEIVNTPKPDSIVHNEINAYN